MNSEPRDASTAPRNSSLSTACLPLMDAKTNPG